MTTRPLVIAPQWIGDAVMAEPLCALLASRGPAPTVAALPWVAPVCRAMPSVHAVIELPFARGRLDWTARRRLAQALRGRHGTAYVLPNSWKSALLPWLAGVRRRIGYQGEARWGLLTERLPNPAGRPAMVGHYGALAGGVAADARPALCAPPGRVDEALRRHGLARGGYTVFAAGAEYGPAKRWPVSHYAALARRLHAADGRPIVLLGSAAEAADAQAIAAAAPGACTVLAGATPLDEAIALLAAAALVVSNDSGLMHVAAAFGVPQAAIFGSTSPAHTPPLNPAARVLWLGGRPELPCIPCYARTCRYGHYRCLADIAASDVAEVVEGAAAPRPTGGATQTGPWH